MSAVYSPKDPLYTGERFPTWKDVFLTRKLRDKLDTISDVAQLHTPVNILLGSGIYLDNLESCSVFQPTTRINQRFGVPNFKYR
jgi:hypothetical protein